jgi:hypothetical protein
MRMLYRICTAATLAAYAATAAKHQGTFCHSATNGGAGMPIQIHAQAIGTGMAVANAEILAISIRWIVFLSAGECDAPSGRNFH